MDKWFTELIMGLLGMFAIPKYGLSSIFIISLVSATLIPMGSEPAVALYVKLNPELFWVAIFVATAGNALGGAVNWWMGYAAKRAYEHKKKSLASAVEAKAMLWLEKLGPKACFFSFLPIIGDPLATLAGWLKFPFWSCFFYGALGKLLRYIVLTKIVWYFWPGQIPV